MIMYKYVDQVDFKLLHNNIEMIFSEQNTYSEHSYRKIFSKSIFILEIIINHKIFSILFYDNFFWTYAMRLFSNLII